MKQVIGIALSASEGLGIFSVMIEDAEGRLYLFKTKARNITVQQGELVKVTGEYSPVKQGECSLFADGAVIKLVATRSEMIAKMTDLLVPEN